MTETSHRVADAAPENWVDRYLPGGVVPYARLMRLDRPIGWWLLLLPCWWGLALGQMAQGGGLPNLWYGFLFFIGAVIMRGAGCTHNDLADYRFDAQVARTRSRPLPSGQVSRNQARLFVVAQLLAGLLILVQFNRYTVVLATASLIIVAIYPFMKRVTHWPQLVLGLAFNWGALVGWAAVHGSLSPAPVLLYAGGIFWTLAYDTIYAHQDKEDDILIGVKSTALMFGAATRRWLVIFFAAALLCIAAAIWQAGGGVVAQSGVGLAALHAAWQVKRFNGDDSALCLALFKSNRVFGLIIVAALVLDAVMR
mgnify:CR=1 FL=1